MEGAMFFFIFLLLVLAAVGVGLSWLPRSILHKILKTAALLGSGLLFALLFRALIDSHLPPVVRVLAFFGLLALSVLFIFMMLRLLDPAMRAARPRASVSPGWRNDVPVRRQPSGDFAGTTDPLAVRVGRLPIKAVLLASLPLTFLAFLILIGVWPPRHPEELLMAMFAVLFFWGVFFALPFSLIVWLCRTVFRGDCPPVGQLKDLLAERLPPKEQARLAGHLEVCTFCQHRIEGLSAAHNSWPGVARKLSDRPPSPEPALQKVMARLKEDNDGATRDEPVFAADLPLGFLSPTDKPGQLGRLERYDVLEEIGRGGMGVVLKAFDPTLHRVVAIKVLAPQLATSGVARKRFLREAKAAAAVTHDHIVTIHAVEESNGLPYLVMQYVAGMSLQDRLDKEGPLELAEVLRIGMQTASGLAAAHGHGIVHRDIKPANILLEDGVQRVKITDFGLARAMDDASLTQSGFVAGSPLYMAPEQARGEAMDHRADLFSLGSVLYTMCTGRPPFRAANTLAVLRRVSEDAPRPIRETNPEIPDWLAEVVEKLLAKEPAERYQSAGEVVEVLGQHLAKLQHRAWVPPPAANAPPAGLPTSVTICPSCGASLHVPESMVGSLVHCAECGKPFHVEEGSEVIQVARAVPSPFGPRPRGRTKFPRPAWIAVGCGGLLLLGLFLMCAGWYSVRRAPMPMPAATVDPTPQQQGMKKNSLAPSWYTALEGLPPEATLFGGLDLQPFGALTLDNEWTRTLLRLILPRKTADQMTPENLGRIHIGSIALGYYEGPNPKEAHAIVHLKGVALDGRKRIVEHLRQTGGEKMGIENQPASGGVRISSPDLPLALGIVNDENTYLAASLDLDATASQHRKVLEKVPASGNLMFGYNPPWVHTAMLNVPAMTCGFFLGEIPAPWRKVLTESLKLRVCPRTFILHLKREGDGVILTLTLNVAKAGTEPILRDDLEKWRQRALNDWQAKFPALRKEPQALAQLGQTLNAMQWKAQNDGSVRTQVRISGPTWKAVQTLLKRIGERN